MPAASRACRQTRPARSRRDPGCRRQVKIRPRVQGGRRSGAHLPAGARSAARCRPRRPRFRPCSLPLRASGPAKRRAGPATLSTADQRQSRALYPVCAARMGLRLRVQALRRAHRYAPPVESSLQLASPTPGHRRQSTDVQALNQPQQPLATSQLSRHAEQCPRRSTSQRRVGRMSLSPLRVLLSLLPPWPAAPAAVPVSASAVRSSTARGLLTRPATTSRGVTGLR